MRVKSLRDGNFGLIGRAQVALVVLPIQETRDADSGPRSGRSPGVGNGNLPPHLCLENFMDRGAWQAAVVGSQSWTPLGTRRTIRRLC